MTATAQAARFFNNKSAALLPFAKGFLEEEIIMSVTESAGGAKKTLKIKISFSDYIRYEIENASISQTEIARIMGLSNSNMVCMYKNGVTKIPYKRIPDIARALRLDAGKLLRMAFLQYDPEMLEVIEKYMGKVKTSNENMLTDYIKAKLGVDNDIPNTLTKEQIDKLNEFIDSLGKKL